jgi:hypothetical protein
MHKPTPLPRLHRDPWWATPAVVYGVTGGVVAALCVAIGFGLFDWALR